MRKEGRLKKSNKKEELESYKFPINFLIFVSKLNENESNLIIDISRFEILLFLTFSNLQPQVLEGNHHQEKQLIHQKKNFFLIVITLSYNEEYND